jgi:Rps23 Pro-64 3,4-dihydroxylase Tpa1-like proline 4-hydroxylase
MRLVTFLNESIDLNLDKISTTYQKNSPYPHIVIDNFLKDAVAKEVAEAFPKPNSEFWFQYNNPIEKKFATDDIRKFPKIIAKLIHALNSQEFVEKVEKLTGIKGLFSDPYLHGGGLHCSKNGGKLDIHLDYSLHPKLEMERRCNLILYLSPEWNESWGGSLEMWDKDMSKCVKKITPQFNRAVIFNTDDISLHGHPDPINCPENISRNSIALYYLSEARATTSSRPRARFFKRPQDPEDASLEEFRKKRSEVSGVYAKSN